jgi:multisubunit Na+/H+ antiporter MnhB subunit
MEQAPSTGQVSPDRQFVWDGSNWAPITGFRWEPTETTRRMQLLAGVVLVVTGLLTTIVSFLAQPYVRQATEKTLRDQNPTMTADQVKSLLDLSLTIGLAVAVGIGLVYLALGLLTLFQRWSWLFYTDLVVLGLTGLGVFTGLFNLARGPAEPIGFVIPNLVLSVAALAVFIWMLVTRLRTGVWGAHKVPTT